MDFKKLIFGLLLLVVIFAVVVLAISVKAVDSLTKVKRLPIDTKPSDFGLIFEELEFKSAVDNLTLKGWFLPSENSDKVVILIHGTGKNRADSDVGFLKIAQGLLGAGFNVLTFDLRAHGESEGARYTLGFLERRDVAGAIAYLESRGFGKEKIGLFGFSLGGELAILTATNFPQIGAVISDSSFADFWQTLKARFPVESGLPGFFVYPVALVARIWPGIDIFQLSPVKAISQMPQKRFLIIHGEKDDIFPKQDALRLKQASKNPKTETWIVPEAGHTQAFNTKPAEYLERITKFFQQELTETLDGK